LSLDLISTTKDAENVDVVHRDIKPKNIVIDHRGNAWLLDFGIARVLDLESKTRTSAHQGPHSPGYSAPEQFRYEKRKITGRSDLFAVGVVLYESAIGTNPFREGADNADEARRRVAEEPLPRLNLVWDVDNKFSDFVASLTQKYPHQRPRSCAEAHSWLLEIVDDLGGI
jgi:serine/threonine-protein kinase